MTAEDAHDVGLGKAVELRRIELGLKRRELAERAQLSYPYISEIENGVKEPSAKALRRIAEALQMKLTDLAALTERVEEASTEASSILLSSLDTTLAVPESPLRYEQPLASEAMPVVAFREATPPDNPDEVLLAVRRELERWKQDELPALVRAEIARQLAALDEGPSDW